MRTALVLTLLALAACDRAALRQVTEADRPAVQEAARESARACAARMPGADRAALTACTRDGMDDQLAARGLRRLRYYGADGAPGTASGYFSPQQMRELQERNPNCIREGGVLICR